MNDESTNTSDNVTVKDNTFTGNSFNNDKRLFKTCHQQQQQQQQPCTKHDLDIIESSRYNTKNKDGTDTCIDDDEHIKPSIYRYKFSEDFTTELYNFAKLHQYDDRKVFKDQWTIWKEENEEIFNVEVERLQTLNYKGDIEDKMFKSARYYFRKKQTSKQEPKERKFYVSVQKELLESIDKHILTFVKENKLKPSIGFIHFCENNKEELKNEIVRLVTCDMNNSEILTKVKKTYKNRYFMLIKK